MRGVLWMVPQHTCPPHLQEGVVQGSAIRLESLAQKWLPPAIAEAEGKEKEGQKAQAEVRKVKP